jgi:hypothetical protein
MKPTDFITETSQIAQEADSMHQDHEVQMARSDCYNAARYAIELHRMLKTISEQQGLDGWVSEKITLANDYLRSVHEYLGHELKHEEEQGMMQFAEGAAEYALEKMIKEDATGGGSSSSGISISMSGGGNHKPGTGKPKKISNAAKMSKVTMGKGVYDK